MLNSAVFLNETGKPMTESELETRWQVWSEGLLTPQGQEETPAMAKDKTNLARRNVNAGNHLRKHLIILTGCDLPNYNLMSAEPKKKLP